MNADNIQAGENGQRLLAPEEFAARVNRSVRTVRRWALGRRPERYGAVRLAGRLAGFHWPTFLARQGMHHGGGENTNG